jgi:hypothetical protein
MSSAQVHTIQELADFRAALLSFAHTGTAALGGADLELNRVRGWLEGQLQHWTAQIRKAEDAVIEAKAELARRRWMAAGGDRSIDCSEQEKNLRRAQAWLDWAEDKKRKTRDWIRRFPDAIKDYESRARPLKDCLEHDVPRMSALLERLVINLEAYTQIGPAAGGGQG